MMKISIAMAVFNGSAYIQEQLDSFVNQTRLPDEVVICDDGSSDKTISIVKAFRRNAPFKVRLIRNSKNFGYIRNFEKAISFCTGDLIFFSDQDDVWFPDKIQYVERSYLENKGSLLFIHDGRLVDDLLRWNGATKLSQVESGFGGDDYMVTGALSVIHKDLKACILPIPEAITRLVDVGHDGWIHLIAKFLDTRRLIRKPLQLIRRHSTNTSDWVASSTSKINRMTVFKSHFDTDPAASYQDRIVLNLALQERLKRIKGFKDCNFDINIVDRSLRYLMAEHRALCKRNALVEERFLARKIAALKILVHGEYKYFNGIMSFLRDLIR